MISFEIIKHQIGNSEVYSVNARDLQDLRTEINIKKSKMVEKFSTKLIIRSFSIILKKGKI